LAFSVYFNGKKVGGLIGSGHHQGFLFSDSLSMITQFYILGFIFMFVSLFIFSTIAMLAGTISNSLKNNKKISLYLKWSQFIVFILIAIFILL
jgi:threonine/homoserine/homoserine lactone efflux protein